MSMLPDHQGATIAVQTDPFVDTIYCSGCAGPGEQTQAHLPELMRIVMARR
jgi:hypothetical protein